MKKIICYVNAFIVFLAVTARSTEPQLRYDIETLNGAKTAELSSPGANKSAFALKLTHDSSKWSRFNWPMFRPLQTADALSISIKREGDLPRQIQVRLLTVDGVEWQSKYLKISGEWQRMVLPADSFRVYRGADKNDKPALDFKRVVQLQVVPQTVKSGGTGCFYLDNFGFESTEGLFTHEKSEQRESSRKESDILLERINDLRKRWSADINELRTDKNLVQQQNAFLSDIVKKMREDDLSQAEDLMRKNGVLWCSESPDSAEGNALPLLSKAEYQSRLTDLTQKPDSVLISHDASQKRFTSTLYQAGKQQRVKRIEKGDSVYLRQQVDYRAEKVRQVVFVTMPLSGEPVNVQGRTIRVKMRCTAKELNERRPMLLRLYTKDPSGKESWAQFAPEPFPGKEWTECVFYINKPVEKSRFYPERVTSALLRIENCIGLEDSFVVELGSLILGWPPAEQRLFNNALSEIDEAVKTERLSLLRQRGEHARLEAALQQVPALNRLYWQGFENPLTRLDELPDIDEKVTSSVDKATSVFAGEIQVNSDINEGKASLSVTHQFGDNCQVEITVMDSEGRTVAECNKPGSKIEAALPQVKLWRPAIAHLYQVDVNVKREGSVVGSLSRKVGFRKSAVRPSGTSTVLRHAVNRGWPDWSMSWNDQGTFGRYACYPMAHGGAHDAEVRDLLDRLWVDGVRLYGFASRPSRLKRDDQFGIATLASVAPSYRGLEGWNDIKQFTDETTLRYELLNGYGDSASVGVLQIGNEVELSEWGADLTSAFPGAPYHPLAVVAELTKKTGITKAPVMYVRAGRFTTIPPMPYEDVCGINQYTGRYSGRMDEIERDLAELSAQALFANRPLMITEWNGPKYSWAGSGIGGVTRRGAAYYLERYWRGLIDTPAVVGSSEFTLNWVIAPFEDLTNVSREEAWKNRPVHHKFSSLNPADHVPMVAPEDVKPNACMRSMQGFHSPFYVMMQRPGSINIVYAQELKDSAQRLLVAFEKLGKTVTLVDESTFDVPVSFEANAHVIALLPVVSEARIRMELTGVIESAETDRVSPLVQTRVHPENPSRLLTVLTAQNETALQRGCERVCESAEALVDLRTDESKMGRVLALTDKDLVRVYERYVLDQVGRGFIATGDDVRMSLSKTDLFMPDGNRWDSWKDMTALILDCGRKLTDDELAIAKRLSAEGVTVVMSRVCYLANKTLQEWCPAKLQSPQELTVSFKVADSLSSPIPVKQFGGIDLDTIKRFRMGRVDMKVLQASEIEGDGEALVSTPEGKPVVTGWQRGEGRVVLFGCDFGDLALLHNRVTRSGQKHRLYDRDTACGLERISRCLINACLKKNATQSIRPRLYLRTTPESMVVTGGTGAVARVTVQLCDVEGNPVQGELLGRARMRADGVGSGPSGFTRLTSTGDGKFEIQCAPGLSADGHTLGYQPSSRLGTRWTTIGIQFKAYADGYIPADGGIAFIVE